MCVFFLSRVVFMESSVSITAKYHKSGKQKHPRTTGVNFAGFSSRGELPRQMECFPNWIEYFTYPSVKELIEIGHLRKKGV